MIACGPSDWFFDDPVQQRFQTAAFFRLFDPLERLARYAHDPAWHARRCAVFSARFNSSHLALDDELVSFRRGIKSKLDTSYRSSALYDAVTSMAPFDESAISSVKEDLREQSTRIDWERLIASKAKERLPIDTAGKT